MAAFLEGKASSSLTGNSRGQDISRHIPCIYLTIKFANINIKWALISISMNFSKNEQKAMEINNL
jgi:hypothetical protein